MATLRKFKVLATHCTIITTSPTRSSPSASPAINFRHRRSLRKLLGRQHTQNPPLPCHEKTPTSSTKAVSLKLKDLLLSSPPHPPRKTEEREMVLSGNVLGKAMDVPRGGGGRGLRPMTLTLRQRLMRKSWRPVLVSIPE